MLLLLQPADNGRVGRGALVSATVLPHIRDARRGHANRAALRWKPLRAGTLALLVRADFVEV